MSKVSCPPGKAHGASPRPCVHTQWLPNRGHVSSPGLPGQGSLWCLNPPTQRHEAAAYKRLSEETRQHSGRPLRPCLRNTRDGSGERTCGRGTLGHHQPGPQQQQMAFLEEPKREKPQPALCWGHDGRAQGERWPGEKESHATPRPEGSEPCRRHSIRTFGPPTHTAPHLATPGDISGCHSGRWVLRTGPPRAPG